MRSVAFALSSARPVWRFSHLEPWLPWRIWNTGTHGLKLETIQSLACKFFELVREHSQLKGLSTRSKCRAQVKSARHSCHHHFGRFSRQLLIDSSTSDIPTEFTQEAAHDYFTEVYHAGLQNFVQPVWMHTPPSPIFQTVLDSGEIVVEEISLAIKCSWCSSSPSPIDKISYLILKRCPFLLTALLDLFNCCWSKSTIPSQWKLGSHQLHSKVIINSSFIAFMSATPGCIANYEQS